MDDRTINQLNAIGTSGIALLCVVLAVVMVCKSRSIFALVISVGIVSLAIALSALAVTTWPTPFQSKAVFNIRPKTDKYQNQDAQINAAYHAAMARKKTAELSLPVAVQIAGIMIPIGLVGLLTRGEIKGKSSRNYSTDTKLNGEI